MNQISRGTLIRIACLIAFALFAANCTKRSTQTAHQSTASPSDSNKTVLDNQKDNACTKDAPKNIFCDVTISDLDRIRNRLGELVASSRTNGGVKGSESLFGENPQAGAEKIWAILKNVFLLGAALREVIYLEVSPNQVYYLVNELFDASGNLRPDIESEKLLKKMRLVQ
jgi:hypothetical protein